MKPMIWLVLLALVLCLGCRKKRSEVIEPLEAPCEDGSCCSPGTPSILYKKLNGEAAFYDGRVVLSFKDPLIVYRDTIRYDGFVVCPISTKNLPKIPYDDSPRSENTQFKYRIWGRIYRMTAIYDFAGNPVHFIAVDRYEVIK